MIKIYIYNYYQYVYTTSKRRVEQRSIALCTVHYQRYERQHRLLLLFFFFFISRTSSQNYKHNLQALQNTLKFLLQNGFLHQKKSISISLPSTQSRIKEQKWNSKLFPISSCSWVIRLQPDEEVNHYFIQP